MKKYVISVLIIFALFNTTFFAVDTQKSFEEKALIVAEEYLTSDMATTLLSDRGCDVRNGKVSLNPKYYPTKRLTPPEFGSFDEYSSDIKSYAFIVEYNSIPQFIVFVGTVNEKESVSQPTVLINGIDAQPLLDGINVADGIFDDYIIMYGWSDIYIYGEKDGKSQVVAINAPGVRPNLFSAKSSGEPVIISSADMARGVKLWGDAADQGLMGGSPMTCLSDYQQRLVNTVIVTSIIILLVIVITTIIVIARKKRKSMRR